MPKRILFLYNQVSADERKGYFCECALQEDIISISDGLKKSGNFILNLDLESPEQLDNFIKSNQPIDMAFVIAEGYKHLPQTLYNGNGAALVRKQLLKHNIPCSHSGIESMEVCRSKDLTFAKLKESGVFIPEYIVFDSHFLNNNSYLFFEAEKIGYPVIIKPAGGGNSIGISDKSVVYNSFQLLEQIKRLHAELGPGVLVIEKYLPGQEYTVGIIGNEHKCILPIIGFPKDLGVRSTKVKKTEHTLRARFEVINELDNRFQNLIDLAIGSFEAVNARDVLRVDIKEDYYGNPYIIDVNGTPSIWATGSLSFMAQKAEIDNEQLVNLILYESMSRYGLRPNAFMEEIVNNIKGKLVQYSKIEVA